MPDQTRAPVLAVVGPTASGKSSAAIRLAERLDGEIISADSMMVYRGMDIGTAKPPAVLRERIRHHLIDVADPSEDFSAALYQPMARRAVEDILSRGRLPIIAGGTGLYVSAALDDLRFPSTEESAAIRRELQEEADEKGPYALHERLALVDPAAAAMIHINNTRRVIRALEVYELTGVKFSEAGAGFKARKSVFNVIFAGLEYEREELYRRINVRTEKMAAAGWAEEAGRLFAPGKTVGKTAAKAIGYSELKRYLDGEISFETAVEMIKMATRRYAKRQMCWFKADKRIVWFNPAMVSGADEAADAIELYFNEKSHIH